MPKAAEAHYVNGLSSNFEGNETRSLEESGASWIDVVKIEDVEQIKRFIDRSIWLISQACSFIARVWIKKKETHKRAEHPYDYTKESDRGVTAAEKVGKNTAPGELKIRVV